jgi:hypothetical protein
MLGARVDCPDGFTTSGRDEHICDTVIYLPSRCCLSLIDTPFTKESQRKTDPDMENATAALIRAAKRAKQLAAQPGTEYVVIRNGKLVREIPNLDERIRQLNATS